MSTETFVEQLFTRFFGRSADLAGRAFWTNLIDSGTATASQVTQSFIDSPEYAGVVLPISRLYFAAFGRPPDVSGLNFFVTGVRAGVTTQQIAADFVRSAEFISLYGPNLTNSGFMDLLYKNVLGRPADAAGKAFWVARLQVDKLSRATVLNSFSNSEEFIQKKTPEIKVILAHQSIIGVTPSPVEISAGLKLTSTQLITQLYANDQYTGAPVPNLNTKGMVVDGYLGGATVFIDQNGNRLLDSGEISTIANVQGNFVFKDNATFNGVLVAENGRDITTGQFFQAQYTAPAGSTVITPITTVLQALIQQGQLSRAQAETLLVSRLQLDADIDLTQFDPIGAAVKPNISPAALASALKIQITAAQINTIVSETAAFLQGAGLTPTAGSGEQAAFQTLAHILLNPSQPQQTDLTDFLTLQLVISHAASILQATPEQQRAVDTLAVQAGQIIAELTLALANVQEATALESLTKIGQIQFVALDFQLEFQAGVRSNDLSFLAAMVAPDALAAAITAARPKLGPVIQDIIAPTLQSSIPADNANPVLANANIVLKFSESVAAGMGNIKISNAVGNAVGTDVRTISITDSSQVTINKDTVTINPTLDFMGGSAYSVMIDKGAIQDLVGLSYAGISDATTLNFTVPTANVALNTLTADKGMRLDAAVATGMSVSAAGDVNGDGFTDYLIGASSTTNTGASFLVFGKGTGFTATSKLSMLSGRDGLRLDGVTAGDFAGRAVAGAGDMNGDGFADVVVGAASAAPGGKLAAGSAYVLLGKSSAFSSTLKLSSLDGKTGFRLDGADANSGLGGAVANAGDVNGDGLDDLIVGADGSNNGTGAAYVVFGKTKGFTATMNVSTLDGSNGFRLSGVTTNDRTGFSVASAGDVNNDGFDDMLVGAFGANRDAGAAYVVFGKATGFDANIDLNTLDGSNGVRFDGANGDNAGRSVARLGDVNGDGFDDILIGAFHANGDTGAAYVVFGKEEPFDANMNLSALDGKNGFRINGVSAGDLTGIAVSGAGDVNGDDLADILIGARNANTAGNNLGNNQSGASYVLYGSVDPFQASVDLMNLNGVNGFRLSGGPGDLSGSSVAGVGDVNGDGFGDLLVGAQGLAVSNELSNGLSYLVFGKNASNVIKVLGTEAANTIIGTIEADAISAGAGNDTITGGGGADFIQGGAGNDRIVISDFDFRLINGGGNVSGPTGGKDTVVLAGTDMVMDLVALNGKIKNIEAIDLTGTGNNELFLNAQEVLQLSNTTNALTILGNKGDAVHLGTVWLKGALVGGLQEFHLGNAVVLVGTAVTVDFV
jgi:methionine-rich copper-binding protein CopC